MNSYLPGLKPVLVAIAGPSGAGKSWLAGQLQQRLGKEAAVLRLDDFYRDLAHLSPGQRERVNFDHPRSIDWAAFTNVLASCQDGRPIQAPRYDFRRHTRQERLVWLRPHPLVIVEGLWVLRPPALRRLFALRIYIDCPSRLQLKRRLQRDAQERARRPESIRRQYRERVAPMARRYVRPQSGWADVLVRSPISNAELDQLESRLRQLMQPI